MHAVFACVRKKKGIEEPKRAEYLVLMSLIMLPLT